MANYQTHLHYTFRDANGDEAQMALRSYSADTATVANLKAASDAVNTTIGVAGTISNAKVVRRSCSILFDVAQTDPSAPNPPIDAEFPSVTDKAHMSFANAGGARSSVSIPAPIEALFQAPPSDAVVDPTQAALAPFITAVEAEMKDATLATLNLYEGGTRTGSRQRLRRGKN
jgi:hypothetical protein